MTSQLTRLPSPLNADYLRAALELELYFHVTKSVLLQKISCFVVNESKLRVVVQNEFFLSVSFFTSGEKMTITISNLLVGRVPISANTLTITREERMSKL